MPIDPPVHHIQDKGKSAIFHRLTGWSLFGGLTLFFFAVQAISGLLLSLHYQPSAQTAHESVARIIGGIPFGWFVRSIHIWSSHLLIISILTHLISKYFLRSYRHPHQTAWLSGIVFTLILLALAFTGYLLPWEVTGYYATQIGTDIVAAAPLVGSFLAGILRGGSDYVDGTTLTRIYSLHTVVLPFIAFLTAFWYARAHLPGKPAGLESESDTRTDPFYSSAIFKYALASMGGSMVLFTLTLWFPVHLGPEATPLTAPPPGIRPEWYFLPVYQAIRVLPGMIGGVATETLIDMTLIILVALLFSLPWIDRGNGRLVRIVGVLILLYAMTAIIWPY